MILAPFLSFPGAAQTAPPPQAVWRGIQHGSPGHARGGEAGLTCHPVVSLPPRRQRAGGDVALRSCSYPFITTRVDVTHMENCFLWQDADHAGYSRRELSL